MKAQEAIVKLLEVEGLTRPDLAHKIGKTPDAVWQRLYNQKNMTVGVFEEMARALGYKVILEPVTRNVTDANGAIIRTRKKYEVTE